MVQPLHVQSYVGVRTGEYHILPIDVCRHVEAGFYWKTSHKIFVQCRLVWNPPVLGYPASKTVVNGHNGLRTKSSGVKPLCGALAGRTSQVGTEASSCIKRWVVGIELLYIAQCILIHCGC